MTRNNISLSGCEYLVMLKGLGFESFLLCTDLVFAFVCLNLD